MIFAPRLAAARRGHVLLQESTGPVVLTEVIGTGTGESGYTAGPNPPLITRIVDSGNLVTAVIKFTVMQPPGDPVMLLDANGMVHGLRPGKATIIGDFDGVKDQVVVTVYAKESAPSGYRTIQPQRSQLKPKSNPYERVAGVSYIWILKLCLGGHGYG